MRFLEDPAWKHAFTVTKSNDSQEAQRHKLSLLPIPLYKTSVVRKGEKSSSAESQCEGRGI
jgi:hypothetical protein